MDSTGLDGLHAIHFPGNPIDFSQKKSKTRKRASPPSSKRKRTDTHRLSIQPARETFTPKIWAPPPPHSEPNRAEPGQPTRAPPGARAGRQSVRLAGGVGGHGLELMEASEQAGGPPGQDVAAGKTDLGTPRPVGKTVLAGGFGKTVVLTLSLKQPKPAPNPTQTNPSFGGGNCREAIAGW